MEVELGALSRDIGDVAALAREGGDVHHEFRAQAAIGKSQVALGGADLVDEDVRCGRALLAGRLRQQQLLDVGDPSFAYLDAGEGFAQQYVGYLQLLADAVIVQAAQLQLVYLQQSLVVGPIQHVEPLDVEPAADVQLVEGPLVIRGQGQFGVAGKPAVPHADAQQILQIGLGQGERQALLLEGTVQGEGAEIQGAIKGHSRLGMQGALQGERAALAGLAAEGPQGELQSREIPQQGLAAAGLGQLERPLADAGLLELPAPGLARFRLFDRRFGGGRRDQQRGQVQLLLLIELGGDGGGLEGEGLNLEGLLAAIDPDPGQGQLVEAGEFASLVSLELPVGQGQPALGDLPCQPLLA
ncbi:hypothetical protein D3C87_1263470 [compost metagenome]